MATGKTDVVRGARSADAADELERAIASVVESAGHELVDVESGGGVLRVTVERDASLDLDDLAEVSRLVSALLDERADVAPAGRYELEVSSPGVERRLRRPAHFARARGGRVAVRTVAGTPGDRRTEGELRDCDDRIGDDRRRRRSRAPDPVYGNRARPHRFRLACRARRRARRTGFGGDEGSGLMSTTNFEFLDALQQIARDKGIAVETLLEALANALVAAYKRQPDAAEEAFVTIDSDSGEIRVYGQELDEDGNVVREWDDTPNDFGRIAAQAAKQVILQRIREAERDLKYEEYAGREGDIVTGIIQQSDNRYTLLDLGKVEALLPQAEQVPYERYDHGARLKAYIVEVRKTSKGPQIVVSRSHPGLIKRLFELEVPEISNGVVEIKACAREPGHRTKIAVWSNDPNVDPVGACVGARGARVRMVTNELRGEKVDIVPYSDEPAEFVARALQPARVKEVRLDEETGTATVIVHDFQLSLAIGKEGQNARLAARLTGWRIDIKSETQLAEEESGVSPVDWAEGEWLQNESGEMVFQPAGGGAPVSMAEWAEGGGPEGAEVPTPGESPAEGEVVAAKDAAAPVEAPAETRRRGGRCRGSPRRGQRRQGRRRSLGRRRQPRPTRAPSGSPAPVRDRRPAHPMLAGTSPGTARAVVCEDGWGCREPQVWRATCAVRRGCRELG